MPKKPSVNRGSIAPRRAAVLLMCGLAASGAAKKTKAPRPDDLPTQVSKLAFSKENFAL